MFLSHLCSQFTLAVNISSSSAIVLAYFIRAGHFTLLRAMISSTEAPLGTPEE
jgi:hypothetical protein